MDARELQKLRPVREVVELQDISQLDVRLLSLTTSFRY